MIRIHVKVVLRKNPSKGRGECGPGLRGARERVVSSQAPWKGIVEPALEPLHLRGVRYQEGDLGAFYSCTRESLVKSSSKVM